MCREKVKDIVKKKGGTITEDEDEATHILYPKVELNNELYARPVFRRGDKCLIHFIMMPDSHDNWGVCYPDSDTPEVLSYLSQGCLFSTKNSSSSFENIIFPQKFDLICVERTKNFSGFN